MGGGQISQERLQGEPWRSFRGKVNQIEAFSRVLLIYIYVTVVLSILV